MLRHFIRKPDQLTYRSPTLDIIHHQVKDESQCQCESMQPESWPRRGRPKLDPLGQRSNSNPNPAVHIVTMITITSIPVGGSGSWLSIKSQSGSRMANGAGSAIISTLRTDAPLRDLTTPVKRCTSPSFTGKHKKLICGSTRLPSPQGCTSISQFNWKLILN